MSERTKVLEPEEYRDPYADSEFQPAPRLTVLQSMRRRPFLVALCVGLLVLGALVYGMGRAPKFTSEARLTVGGIDLSKPGALSAFASATQALATAYSRAVSAEAVTERAARETGLSPLEVRARLLATPIPDSPLFRIEATGANPQQAIKLANVTSEALSDYIKRTSTARNPASSRLLKEYREVQVDVTSASQAFANAKRRARAENTSANQRALATSAGKFEAARLRAEAISTAYVQSTTSRAPTQSVQLLAPATFATSDRWSKLQIYLFIALVAGVVLGAALATLAEDRYIARALRRR